MHEDMAHTIIITEALCVCSDAGVM